MASESERAAILAEYKAAAAAGFSDEDDEADFNPSDDSDSGEEPEEEPDYAILDGSLILNDEGRLMYSGLWSMKSDPHNCSKFKMRSKDIFHSKEQLETGEKQNGDETSEGPKKASPLLFDLYHPTQTKIEGNGSTRRTLLFDGFFFVKSNEKSETADHKSKGEKVKERDVEIFIQQNSGSYEVTGRGHNNYGPFVLEGKYTVPKTNQSPAVMELHKTYGSGGSAKDTDVARGKRKNYDSDEDDDYEEKTGFAELIELTEDANLSVEELRKKYYGGGDGDAKDDETGGGGKMPSKKARLDESDDSDCGF